MDYNKIKCLAEKRGISIAELCRRIGISDVGFYQMIPKNRMKINTLEKIADVLGVNPGYFFDKNNEDVLEYEIKKGENQPVEDPPDQDYKNEIQLLRELLKEKDKRLALYEKISKDKPEGK